MSIIGEKLNEKYDLVVAIVRNSEGKVLVPLDFADPELPRFDGPWVDRVVSIDAPDDGDPALWSALRLGLEITGGLPGASSAKSRKILNRLNEGQGLWEAARDEGVTVDLNRVAPVARGERAHGGLPLGEISVFEVDTDSEPTGVPGRWISAKALLAEWESGRATMPPALRQGLGQKPRILGESFCWINGIRWIPLETPTLPPATHVNCYILGHDELTVVDPGSPHKKEQDRLAATLKALEDDGQEVVRVLLTHEHSDHVGGLDWFAERDIPIWAPAGADIEHDVECWMEGGEEIGDRGATVFEVFNTPGHIGAHVSLKHKASGSIVTGDLVAAVGTIVVSPPEGNMADYFRSLRDVRDMRPPVLFPSHGPAVTNPLEHLDAYIAHRQGREDAIVSQLDYDTPLTTRELVERVYTDVPPAVWPMAERNVDAHLEKLLSEQRAARTEEGYVFRDPPSDGSVSGG